MGVLFKHIPAERLSRCVQHALEQFTDGGDLFVGTRDLLADFGSHPIGIVKVGQHASAFTLGPLKKVTVADLQL